MSVHNFAKVALSAVGALFFTVTMVGASVVPAHMAEAAPLLYAAAAPQVAGVAHA
jgi:hypothetical protein